MHRPKVAGKRSYVALWSWWRGRRGGPTISAVLGLERLRRHGVSVLGRQLESYEGDPGPREGWNREDSSASNDESEQWQELCGDALLCDGSETLPRS